MIMLMKAWRPICLLYLCIIIIGVFSTQQLWAESSPATVRTLILTNRARLDALYGTAATTALFAQLASLSTHAAVEGKIVQVENTAAVASAYNTWLANLTSTTHANAVADAIKNIIVQEANANFALTYVVLVGDDRVLPFYRIADETPNSSEKGYTAVPNTTTTGAALANNMLLTDDFYGDLDVITSTVPHLAELPVGRLVETPSEMTAAITQFLSSNGQIHTNAGLVAGFDFVKDAAQQTCTSLTNPPTQVPMSADCTLIGDTWSATELDNKLVNSGAGLLFFYTHADHAKLGTPKAGTLLSDRVAQWNFPSAGRLVYNISDHSGLSVPPETTEAFDWPQAWVGRGAVYVASTGYSWGLSNSIGFAEKLGTLFSSNIVGGMPGVVVGEALNAAKRTYYTAVTTLSAYDKKTLNELTLYGLPMYKIMAVDSSASPTPTPTFSLPTPTPTTQVSSVAPGALIVITGRLRLNDLLQPNINHVGKAVYNRFFSQGYGHERIYYIASDSTIDATGDGTPDVDATATITTVRTAITQWAVNLVGNERPLTLYLMDHGAADVFYLDQTNQQILTPANLDEWLRQLEATVPNLQINVVIDQVNAGSFISVPGTLSKAGRLIIASAKDDQLAYASANGALFSDAFIAALTPGVTLYQAFQSAKSATTAKQPNQMPVLDGNGNGVTDEVDDQAIAAARLLFAGSANMTPTVTPPPPTVTLTPLPPTATPLASLTPTPTSVGSSDAFESDNLCPEARTIPTNGTLQTHTFHVAGDVDWVKFEGVSGATYQIDVTTPQDSQADVQMELYAACGGSSTAQDSLGPGVRMRVKPTANSSYYLRLVNYDPAAAGQAFSYQVAVSALPTEPMAGALVIVAGRLRVNDPLQTNIYQATNNFYKLFLSRGYTADRIFYLANDQHLDPDNTPLTEDIDAFATRDRLKYAITQWALDPKLGLGPNRAFTLYMMDHGDYDTFYLNGRAETIAPDELDQWLTVLEQAAPGVKVNIIIDACKAGSFIDSDRSLSKPGRVVITSASNNELAYTSNDGVTVFTSPFVQALASEKSLYHAFQEVQAVGLARPFPQTVWLDDNGNGIANEASDGLIAQQRGFAFAGSLSPWDSEPPYILWAAPPTTIENRRGQIRAHVQSEIKNFDVWAVIYEPSYAPPLSDDELVPEGELPIVRLEDTDGDQIYTGTFSGFDQPGKYQIVVYAEDDNGLRSRPKSTILQMGGVIYLPLISHK